ncbi:MAG: TonB-dependent receptor [Prolixibacteraceae bacterium]
MRLTVLLVLLGILNVSGSVYSQNFKMTLSIENSSTQEVFDKIESISDFKFFYQNEQIDQDMRFDIDFENERVEDILDEVLRDTDLQYQVMDDNLIVISLKEGAEKQTEEKKSIEGAVIDKKTGEPIPGVNVIIQGTWNGTTTDFDGKFKFGNVNPGVTLMFSFIGYASQWVKVENVNPILVKLAQDSKSLEEVVVVGYGEIRKKDLTGSVSQVFADDLNDMPVARIDQALQGKMAGVSIQQSTGQPGESPIIRIRGVGSLSAGNNPLYVVDGYPITGDLRDINPNDIETIEVLKDASACAIYGSRGSNGVILITTRLGKKGEQKLSFNMYTGFQKVLNKVDALNAEEYSIIAKEMHDNAWLDYAYTNGIQASANDPNDVRLKVDGTPDDKFIYDPNNYQPIEGRYIDTDWQDEIFETAPIKSYQLSASGGNEKTRYMISAGYMSQDGVVMSTDYERYTARTNIVTKITDKITAGLQLAPSFSSQHTIRMDGIRGPVLRSIYSVPSFPVKWDDGTWAQSASYGYNATIANQPVSSLMGRTDKNELFSILGNLYLEIEILKNLKFKSTAGADIWSKKRHMYEADYAVWKDGDVGGAEYNTYFNRNWLNENTLNYNLDIGEKHRLNALAGYTLQKNYYEWSNMSANNFPNDDVQTLNAGKVYGGSQSISEWSMISYLARVNYSYNDKYLLTASIRRDGSSRFGLNTKWGVFPSTSMAWRISEESFLKEKDWLSDMKIRVGYGETGNNAIGDYAAQGTIGTGRDYIFGGQITPGLSPNGISNYGLKWEKTQQFNTGINVSIIDSRFNFSLDYYSSKTKDLLLNVPIPTITGYSRALVNIGQVSNKGWEFEMHTVNIEGDFTWTTDFNISQNRNKVLKLGPAGDPILGGHGSSNITQIGSPVGLFYGYDQIGVWNSWEEIAANPHFASAHPGDARMRDVNGDTEINAKDMTDIGSWEPDFTYGMTNTFRYKNIDFSLVFAGSQGNEIYNLAMRYYGVGSDGNSVKKVLGRWQSAENTGDGMTPRVHIAATGLSRDYSSRWVEDGSYLLIQNITIGYTLPTKLINKLYFKSCRLYASAQNPKMFTNYSFYNPMMDADNGNPLGPGVDFGAFPLSQVYSFGLNVTF